MKCTLEKEASKGAPQFKAFHKAAADRSSNGQETGHCTSRSGKGDMSSTAARQVSHDFDWVHSSDS
ncbi:hypothetical protein AC579_2176 [Pseudocercospora musae]|uniref:Uncharacterized protein n=1 Tax=Pseudocercospora musae TaxID=113226 RepID=A0A139HYE6_9PEZI|nr:hypothetical protein AC579_2176 [Pseudocercospora musae]